MDGGAVVTFLSFAYGITERIEVVFGCLPRQDLWRDPY